MIEYAFQCYCDGVCIKLNGTFIRPYQNPSKYITGKFKVKKRFAPNIVTNTGTGTGTGTTSTTTIKSELSPIYCRYLP